MTVNVAAGADGTLAPRSIRRTRLSSYGGPICSVPDVVRNLNRGRWIAMQLVQHMPGCCSVLRSDRAFSHLLIAFCNVVFALSRCCWLRRYRALPLEDPRKRSPEGGTWMVKEADSGAGTAVPRS